MDATPTQKGNKTMEPVFICMKNTPHSTIHVNNINDKILKIFQKAGYEIAAHGKKYEKIVRCPVNGDTYTETRRYLLDSEKNVVGSYKIG